MFVKIWIEVVNQNLVHGQACIKAVSLKINSNSRMFWLLFMLFAFVKHMASLFVVK